MFNYKPLDFETLDRQKNLSIKENVRKYFAQNDRSVVVK